MPILILLFALSPFLPSTLAPSLHSQSHDLPLGRALKPSDVYFLRASATRIIEVLSTADPKKPVLVQADTTVVNINAKCEVAAVTVDGQEAKKIVTIRHVELKKGGTTKDILNTGAALTITYSDSGTVMMLGTTPVDPAVADLLSLVLQAEGGKRTGEIMDAKRKVKVGDTWSIDTTALLRSMDIAVMPPGASVTGVVKFDKIDSKKNLGTAIMKATMTNVFPTLNDMKPNTSQVDATVSVTVPLDVRYPTTHVSTTTTLVADFGQGASATVVRLRSTDDRSFER